MDNPKLESSVFNNSLELAKNFLQRLIGPPIDEIGLLLSDNVKIWRLRNQLKNLEKVKKIVDENNVSIKQISLKILVPYLEGISLEDNEELQNIWANLFVNYIDSEKNLQNNVYPLILRQLSTDDINILIYLEEKHKIYVDFRSIDKINHTYERMINLERLGLIREVVGINKYGYESKDFETLSTDEFYLTKFGSEFIMACKR